MKKTLLFIILTILSAGVSVRANNEGRLSTISYLFTTAGGLSSAKVTCIIQEDRGFFWIGTEDGLNKFDGYDFTIYKKQYADSLSLASNHITAMYQDSRRQLWIATMEGLQYYEPTYDGFVGVSLNQPDEVLRRNPCTAMMEDRSGNLWFASYGIGVVRYSPATGESHLFTPSGSPGRTSLGSAYIRTLAEDSEGRIWMGSHDNGISIYDPAAGAFVAVPSPGSASGLPGSAILDLRRLRNGNMLIATSGAGLLVYDAARRRTEAYPELFRPPHAHRITCTAENSKGDILVGTGNNGIFVFDPQARTLRRHPILEEFSDRLDNAPVSSLYIGLHDYIWAGMKYQGVFVAGNENSGFRTFKKIPSDPNSLSNDYVASIATDRQGDIWIATDGGGLNRYETAAQRFTCYAYQAGNPRSLSDNAVLSVFCDDQGRIWTGASAGILSLFDRRTGSFTHYRPGRAPSNPLRSDPLKTIAQDRQGFLWLGTQGGGLICFKPDDQTFRTWRSSNTPGLPDDYVNVLLADSLNRLWIGTNSGLSCRLPDTGAFTAYAKADGLSSEAIYSLGQSPDGAIWAGTANGLHRYDPARNAFEQVYPRSLRETAVINGIVPDGQQLWLSTNRGLVCYTIPDGDVKTYSQSNSGVGSDEFLQGACHKSPGGEIFFGGATGLTTFYPSDIQDSVTIQKVYITQLSLSNKPVPINKEINGRIVLARNIGESPKIVLRYSDKTFTLGFVAIGSFKPYSTVFACKLEGFDRDWILHDYAHRNVTYTNLNPGTYVFRVKASTDPEVWGDEDTTLIIEVEPPLWNTWWAKVLYVLSALAIAGIVLRFFLIRLHEKNELRIERMKGKQQEELNRVRTNFFTNISHEFRTPLTLIIGPLQRLIGEDKNEERRKAGLMILRNAERLQHLINQILDLNKIEEGKMKLHVQPIELVSFVSHATGIFTELMKQKQISLTYAWHPDRINIWYDSDMLDKCMNNLLYNAFKFTPEGGKIHIEVRQQDNGDVLLTVGDTGIGMNRETREHLFDRFFQGPQNNGYTGTGIGMHLTKTIIDLHKGSITVDSEEGKGSRFYIGIRPGNEHFTDEELETKDLPSSPAPKSPAKGKTSPDGQPVLLLIEDSGDMRSYIRQELAGDYVIEEAADGKTGLEMALRLMPDLIITDVMMPQMSGTELCRTLKSTPETSHIPIIILTAQDEPEHRLEGVESGADSFITKPFNTKYLQARIGKLIELRRKMKERFSKSIYMDAQEVTLTSMDERLLQKAIDYVRTHIEDPTLSVEQMSRELGMSRTHLHRKLKALTGQSPVEFIKMIRMKQAAYLLTTGKLSVSEVGYRVGYSTPSYFSSSFNAHFGMSPTAYMEKAASIPRTLSSIRPSS